MYVMCISNKFIINDLTIGKVYKVTKVYDEPNYCLYYEVKGDRGINIPVDEYRFKIIKENKINKLLYKEL